MASSARARREAFGIDRRVSEVVSIAERIMPRYATAARVEVIRAVRSGRNWRSALRKSLLPARQTLAYAMTSAALLGRARSLASIPRRRSLSLDRFEDTLGSFQAAIDFATKRAGISKAVLDGIISEFEAAAADAFKPMQIEIESAIREGIASSVKDGLHFAGTAKRVREAMDKAGVGVKSPWILETQVRTQSQLAFAAGRLAANEAEEIQDILWGYEYVTVGDDRVRPGHAALDGMRLPKDHPRWAQVMPPNGWNCRCTVIEIFKGDELATTKNVPKRVEVDGDVVTSGADEGFKFNPLDVLKNQESVVRGLGLSRGCGPNCKFAV